MQIFTGEVAFTSNARLIKNRWPSARASKVASKLGSCVSKSATGIPASNAAPAFIGTAISLPSRALKNSSLPSRRHIGTQPPAVETCHLPAVTATTPSVNART
jgi:hypothetical protein